CAVAVTIADSEEVAVTAVSAPFAPVSPCTAVAKLDKSVLIVPMAVACVCSVVTSACQAVNCPLWEASISDTIELTSMPFPFNRLAELKLIPMSFLPSGSGCRSGLAVAQFRRFFGLLCDSALHAKLLVARHLQDHVLGVVQVLNDYLVLNLRILVHFDYILRQIVGCGDFLCDGVFSSRQCSRNGLRRFFCYTRRGTCLGVARTHVRVP